MKKYVSGFLVLSFIVVLFILCPFNSNDLFAVPVYESISFKNLYAAVTAIGGENAILIVKGKNVLEQDLTVPPNIIMKFQEDGALSIGVGKTVTIDSPIQAPVLQIFKGEGRIVLKRSDVYPQWWGAKGDGFNDDGYAIQAAIDSVHAGGGGVVRLKTGTYLLNHITGAYYAIKSKNKVSVVGEGSDSVLRIGSKLRTATQGVAILYNHEEPVSQCRYAFFTVDYNGKDNLRLASWGRDARVSNVSRMGADFASNLVIENVWFKDVTGAHCIWIGNHPANRNNIIRNCMVSNVGESIPSNQINDHSSVYIGGSQGIVTGNIFHNDHPCNVSTAIEIHSSDTIVSNNIATNYSTAVNIAGEANDCSQVTVTNNTFKNCRNGIVLWHYSPFVLKNMTLSGNVISIRESDGTPYPPSMGIIYGNGYVTSKTNMSGLKITGNTIYQETVTVPRLKPNTAIHIEGVDDVTISGNAIYNLNGEAIFAMPRSTDQGMVGVIISGNSIRNVGITTTLSRKRAIAFNAFKSPKGSIDIILVQGNIVIADDNSPMRNGLTFNEGLFKYVDISGNTINGASSFEIMRNTTEQGGLFHINHVGKGPPDNKLKATNGSRWFDATNGNIYKYYRGQAVDAGKREGWILVE